MSTYNLDAFLKPSSVALIGASRRQDSVGAISARNLAGFAGRVFRINHHATPDPGAGLYRAIEALPAAPDLAIIAVPAPGVPAVIQALGRLGTRAAVVLSAGFSETQAGAAGKAALADMLATAHATGMRIAGPNCIGILAPHAGLNAGFAQTLPPAGGIAFLSQSGAVLTTLIDWARARGIGFSAMVSLGEMAEVDVADWLDYLATDPQTQAILLYLESVTHARKFMSAARHAARLKPVIALKSGRSPAAAAAAASHSGALAGGDLVFDAAFRRAGIQRVPTVTRMLEAAETLAYAQPLQGESLALLTNGGGMGVLAADQLAVSGGALRPLDAETRAALDVVLPATWSHGNPIDIVGDADPGRYRAAMRTLLAAPAADAVAVMCCPTGLGDAGAAAAALAAELRTHPGHKPVLAAWLGPQAAAAARTAFGGLGIPNFDTPEGLVRGFLQLAERRRQQAHLSETVAAFPLRGASHRDEVRRRIEAALHAGVEWLDEAGAKALLAAAGIEVNATRRARTPAEARAAALALPGPYAVKILSPDLLHKSDVGGVALNVETADEVARITERMLTRLREAHPQARLAGVSVQPMVDRAGAQELIAGVSEDPIFGPVILFGAGGVTVEAVDDTALALPPLNANLARDLIERTRIHRVLAGAKGRLPPADMDALVGLLIRLSELVCEFPEIVELDLNPVLGGPRGAIALDARVRLHRAHGRATERLAIMPYPRELERPFALPDGTKRLLRPIRPEDEMPLRQAFARLSPDSRYMRMFATLRDLPHELAARSTQIDYDREMAFVISEDKPAGEAELFGGVRLISDANHERAEFSITVIDHLAGHGVGRRLMQVIIDYARRTGLSEIAGQVLSDNQPMLALCRELGFQRDSPADGIVAVKLVLA